MSNELAQQAKPVSALAKFNALLGQDTIKKKFEEALGKKAPMFVSNLTTIMSGSAELQKCEHMSIISSALMAASMDLPLTPGLGFAGIVPYWDSHSQSMKAQFQVMKKGYIQLAQRTGLFKIINVSEVYEGEMKSHNRFTGEYVFDESGKKSDKIIGYVSYFKLVNGFEKFLYMPIEKLDAHAKKYSKSFQKGKGKWADKEEGGYEQMCEKTVLKLNLSTYAPLSVDINMMNAVIYDQAEIRDVDAKDFGYVDNDEAAAIENKEVLEIGKDKTITINDAAGAKAETISNNVTNLIDKANGKHKEPIQEAEIVPDNPPAEESKPKVWTADELTNLKDGIYEKIKEILPPAKVTVLESLPGRKSNKLYRDAVLYFQNGQLDNWLMGEMSRRDKEEKAAGSQPKEETPVDGSDIDKVLSQPQQGITTKQATESFEAEKKVPEKKEGEFVVPPFGEDGKRKYSDMVKLYNDLLKLGVDRKAVADWKVFLTEAPEEEILLLAGK